MWLYFFIFTAVIGRKLPNNSKWKKYFSVFTKLAMSLESSVFFDEWKTFFWRSDKVKQSHSPEVARYLYKSTIFPCMEYCCHVWAGTPSCYLELLDKLQKRICRTVGPSLTASLEPLAHRRNVDSLSLFYTLVITLVDVYQNWLYWFRFLFLERGLLVILIDCMIFLSPFLDVTRMSIC